MSRCLCFLLCLAASQASAQAIVPPAAFEALSTGRTLHFTLDGQPFGSEQFFAGRRSLWRYADATCEPGVWRAEGQAICFEYDTSPEAVCWHFVETPEGYAAQLVEDGAPSDLRLDLARIGTDPLPCPGPEVGS